MAYNKKNKKGAKVKKKGTSFLKEAETISEKTKAVGETRLAMLNILEDVEEARRRSEEEGDKTKSIVSKLEDG